MSDLWFYGILNFWKKGRGGSNFRKIRAIVLKLHNNILHPSRNFGVEFGQNRLKRSNFFKFWIFWKFFQNCLTQANFDLSSWNFVGKCTNTEWCLIPNFIRIGGDLWILDEFFFFIVTSNYKNSRKPKSSNLLPQRKNFVKSVGKQYGNPDSHPFFLSLTQTPNIFSKHLFWTLHINLSILTWKYKFCFSHDRKVSSMRKQ